MERILREFMVSPEASCSTKPDLWKLQFFASAAVNSVTGLTLRRDQARRLLSMADHVFMTNRPL